MGNIKLTVGIIFFFLCLSKGNGQFNDFNESISVKHPPGIMLPMDRPPHMDARIMGGSTVKPHEYPYQVALVIYHHSHQWFCGGTLFGNQWILTAAHCLLKAKRAKVFLGAHNLKDLEPYSRVIEAKKFIIHKHYDENNLFNDIALIKLPKTIIYNDFIQPVTVAYGTDEYVGSSAICLGWGIAESGHKEHVLRYVEVPILANKQCKKYQEYRDYLTDGHVCTAGDHESGSCAGDSGGPLILKGKQVGVVSFGTKRCDSGYPSVYTRVTQYTHWLSKKTGVRIDEKSGRESKMGVKLCMGAMLSVVMVLS